MSVAFNRGVTWRRPVHWLVSAWAIALAVGSAYWLGIPVDHVEALAVCVLFSILLAREYRLRGLLAVLVDWSPIAATLLAFDYLHGAALETGIAPDFALSARLERRLTGTVPTVDLQNWMYGHGYFHWWNVPITLIYLSHFVVPYAILVTLWVRDRQAFRGFRLAYIVVTAVSLSIFMARPTAPPWAASQHGGIGLVSRTAVLGLNQLHLHAAHAFVSRSMDTFNPYSAFPSLHAAMSALPLLWWGASTTWPRRSLLGLYALAMGFVLVATGEHWVTDVVAGWACAGVAVAAARRRT